MIDEVARRADIKVAQINVDRPLFEFGLSSRGLVELLGALSETLGRSIDPSVLFEHPTISALANSLFVKDTQDRRAAASDSAPVRDDDPIAVVGIGCRLPGGVDSMDDLWELTAFSEALDDLDMLLRKIPQIREAIRAIQECAQERTEMM
ncbi:hypothetical protein BO226_24965 (plasmid) [Rhodococcus sp. 2G]|uniref:acyl carrier protein n=1 Tax=Rhodococcus sp. 2G TaxID=1570939 RepID=UPI00090370A6|nr:acyl carrier protein [Rhodococcus sp. 2G]APE12611.1 hypothetical protein BO226_24965 [Rhodococcus sp. 2G]